MVLPKVHLYCILFWFYLNFVPFLPSTFNIRAIWPRKSTSNISCQLQVSGCTLFSLLLSWQHSEFPWTLVENIVSRNNIMYVWIYFRGSFMYILSRKAFGFNLEETYEWFLKVKAKWFKILRNFSRRLISVKTLKIDLSVIRAPAFNEFHHGLKSKPTEKRMAIRPKIFLCTEMVAMATSTWMSLVRVFKTIFFAVRRTTIMNVNAFM